MADFFCGRLNVSFFCKFDGRSLNCQTSGGGGYCSEKTLRNKFRKEVCVSLCDAMEQGTTTFDFLFDFFKKKNWVRKRFKFSLAKKVGELWALISRQNERFGLTRKPKVRPRELRLNSRLVNIPPAKTAEMNRLKIADSQRTVVCPSECEVIEIIWKKNLVRKGFGFSATRLRRRQFSLHQCKLVCDWREIGTTH